MHKTLQRAMLLMQHSDSKALYHIVMGVPDEDVDGTD